MKFSIIIPVYNVEKYIRKCLESVEKQTYQEYEVIIVNDGTQDHSQEIIDEFVNHYPEKFKSFIKENGGLSDARNYGVKQATGEYIVFLDADDYIDERLLQIVHSKIESIQDLELMRVPIHTVTENGESIDKEILEEKLLTGEQLLIELRKKRKCIEPAWAYVIERTYWNKNRFTFPKGKLHEDFAIMLMVVLKAKKAYMLQEGYYHYVMRQNSIMTNKSYDNELRKGYDKLEHYDAIVKEVKDMKTISKTAKETCLEYISTAVCMELQQLQYNDKKAYQYELKKRHVLNNIKCNTFRNILRKLVLYMKVNF